MEAIITDSNFPKPVYLRVSQIVKPHGILPIARSTWYAGIAAGLYPRPVKLGVGISVWSLRDILALAENGVPRAD